MNAASVSRTAKESIRHLLSRSGSLARLSIVARKALGQNVDHLLLGSLTDRFSAVYSNGVWLNGREAGALSGLGSELESTAMIRHRLPEMLVSLGTRVLLDIGCGDLTWMKELELPCKYIGVDIVPEVIAGNLSRFRSPSRSFVLMDATCEMLPSADTILCREILFHLCFRDIWCLLENVRRSGACFLMSTNDPGLALNADIISGDFRMLNLERPPFRFPKPTLSLQDDAVSPDRNLSIWEISALPRLPHVASSTEATR